MKLNLLLILSIIFFVISSCSDETEEIIEKEPTPVIDYLIIDTTKLGYTFKKDLKTVVVYDPVFNGNHPINIDINGDSIDDIKFSSSYLNSGAREESLASIKTLNDSISIDTEQYTTLIANYSKKIPDSSNEKDSIIRYYKENYNDASVYPANLRIDTLYSLYPVIYSLADTIKNQQNWSSGDFILKSGDNSWYVATNVKMGIWRDINRKFIGLRFLDKDQYYFGWIELSIKGYEITLYKSACKHNKSKNEI